MAEQILHNCSTKLITCHWIWEVFPPIIKAWKLWGSKTRARVENASSSLCVNRDNISSVLWPRRGRMSTAPLEFAQGQTRTKSPRLQSFPWQMSRYVKKDFYTLAAGLPLLVFKSVFSKEHSRNCQRLGVICPEGCRVMEKFNNHGFKAPFLVGVRPSQCAAAQPPRVSQYRMEFGALVLRNIVSRHSEWILFIKHWEHLAECIIFYMHSLRKLWKSFGGEQRQEIVQ